MDEDEIRWSDEMYRIFGFDPQEFANVQEVREDAPSDDHTSRGRSGKPFTATRIGTASTID